MFTSVIIVYLYLYQQQSHRAHKGAFRICDKQKECIREQKNMTNIAALLYIVLAAFRHDVDYP